MPNGRIHRRVGRPVGALYAAAQATRSPLGDPLIEGLGGWLGGGAGATCPDLLEPASWNHRQTAHSISAGALLGISAETIQSWSESCRRRADRHCRLAADPRLAEALSVGHSLIAMFWSMLAGWLNGFLAGYVSHLVLDACTPACIPLT